MTVIVTGAGFIAGHLLAELERRNIATHHHTRADGDLAHCAIQWPAASHIFHLAARSFVPESWTNPLTFYEANILGTVNVLEFCRRSGAALTFMSSYVYGVPRALPIAETHPLDAPNPYAHTKILGEDICRFYAKTYRSPVCIVRPFNIYGPGQDGRFLIPHILQQALDPTVDTIEVADLRPRRDYLHVSDLVRLLLGTMERPEGVYNAGSGQSTSVGELIGMVNATLRTPKRVISRNVERPAEIPDVIADCSKAWSDFGWAPQIHLEQGLAELLRRPTQQL